MQHYSSEAIVARRSGLVQRGPPAFNRAASVVRRSKPAKTDYVEASRAQGMKTRCGLNGRRSQLNGPIKLAGAASYVRLASQRLGFCVAVPGPDSQRSRFVIQ